MSDDPDTPEIRAARMADPFWQTEQERKSQAASERFAQWRHDVGMPLIERRRGER